MLPLVPYSKRLYRYDALHSNGMTVYGTHEANVQGFRQKKPYNVLTPMQKQIFISLYGEVECASWSWDAKTGQTRVLAENLARKRFVNKLGDVCQWGSTLTSERAKTWSSVIDIVTRCAKAARQVSRLELLAAANTLGLPYRETTKRFTRTRTVYVSRKNGLGRMRVKVRLKFSQQRFSFGTGRDYVKNVANGWLMYSYGVKPLTEDIYRGMDALQQPIPENEVKAGGRETGVTRNPDGWGNFYVFTSNVRVHASANVRVDNPNLWLCNQLGLVNPVQWINEGIPFSFVLDWFSNLSQVIQQWTDFVGLSVTEPCMLVVATAQEEFLNVSGNPYITAYGKKRTDIERSLTMPQAKLVFTPERFELQRGLNAISLLIGFLPKK